jgi:hypothetical protein
MSEGQTLFPETIFLAVEGRHSLAQDRHPGRLP